MNRLAKLNVGIIIAFIGVFYIAYYFLVQDNFLHISITSIINNSHRLKESKHLLVLGLLPIYIATMIFGAGLVGMYLGSALQHFFMRIFNKPFFTNKKKFRKFSLVTVRDKPLNL